MLVDVVPRRDEAPPRPTGLVGAYAALLMATFALLVLGPLVRAHGAGLACPDWPLCFGEFVPRLDLRVGLEWSHRVLAGAVGVSFAGLAALSWRRTAPGEVVRRVIVLASAVLVIQILLGALTVWKLLASWTVTSHLLAGHAFAAAITWIALDLHERSERAPAAPRPAAGARRALGVVIALLLVQVTLGGLVSSRYAGLACPEWPACHSGVWFPSWRGPEALHMLHRTHAYLLLVALAALLGCGRREGRLGALALLAAGLGLLQLGVGVANVLWRLPVELTGLHSALATALVLTCTAAAREAWGRRESAPGMLHPPRRQPCARTKSSRP